MRFPARACAGVERFMGGARAFPPVPPCPALPESSAVVHPLISTPYKSDVFLSAIPFPDSSTGDPLLTCFVMP